MPDALLSELTPREHQLVHALLSYGPTIYPSVRTLATRLRCTDRTIQRTLRQLEERGYLIVQARYRDDQGQTSNLYVPGPMLAPSLSPGGHRDGTGPATDRGIPPVTRRAAERDAGNQRHQRSRYPAGSSFDARNYYLSSDGYDIRNRT